MAIDRFALIEEVQTLRAAPRFATLMGLTTAYGWLQDGPHLTNLEQLPLTGSQFE